MFYYEEAVLRGTLKEQAPLTQVGITPDGSSLMDIFGHSFGSISSGSDTYVADGEQLDSQDSLDSPDRRSSTPVSSPLDTHEGGNIPDSTYGNELDVTVESDDEQQDDTVPQQTTVETPVFRRSTRTQNPAWTQPRFSPSDWTSRHSSTSNLESRDTVASSLQEVSGSVGASGPQNEPTRDSEESMQERVFLTSGSTQAYPNSFKEAMSRSDADKWKRAMDEEYASLVNLEPNLEVGEPTCRQKINNQQMGLQD